MRLSSPRERGENLPLSLTDRIKSIAAVANKYIRIMNELT